MEENKAFLNRMYKRHGKGRRDCDKWLAMWQSVEHDFVRRREAIEFFGDYAAINRGSVKRNKIFKDLVQNHSEGKLTLDEYFDAVVKENTKNGGEMDLPKEMQEELLGSS